MWRRNQDRQELRVLLVDDETPVRQVARRVLEQGGCTVTEAESGAEAVAHVETGLAFDVLLADLDMPEMRGQEMVWRIRRLRSNFKVLYVTGYIDSLMDDRPLLEDEAFLEKPYTTAGLLEAVSLLAYGTLRGLAISPSPARLPARPSAPAARPT